MSTTIEVYPSTSVVPTYAELLELASARLSKHLRGFGLDPELKLQIKLLTGEDDQELPISLNDKAIWPEETYAWFYVDGRWGGTDAYFWPFDDWDYEYLQEDLLPQPRFQARAGLIQATLEIGHRWHFRRFVGQPAWITVAYGILAASLAELTEGLVYSDDGAWDWERFPALPSEFYDWYFVPEKALSANTKAWSEGCIAELKKEFGT